MSLITSCPACDTRFKIVPDQLKISDGWVRCGTCGEVFDASKRLEDPEASTPRGMAHVPVLVETFDPPAPPPITPSPTPAPPPDLAAFTPSEADAPIAAIADDPPAVEASPAPTSSEVVPSAESPVGVEPSFDTASPLEPGPLESEISPGYAQQAQADLSSRLDLEDETGSQPEDLQFIKQARRAAMWKRPWVRAVLALLLVLFGVLLALQYIIHERDRLAARNPQTRELLTSLCHKLGCEVRALRDPEAIVIESSRFQKNLSADNGVEIYQLSVQLRNRADHAVAWPELELSLTGMNDQAIVRVVINAAKYAPADSPDIAAGREYTANIPIKLDPTAAGGRISGYRLLAFYP